MTRARALPVATVLLLTALVYAPVAGHDFVSMDDMGYVARNPRLASGLTADSLAWALTSFERSNWHPLTWMSHLLDVSLFGMRPGWHHLTSLLLHLAATWLLYLAFAGATGAPLRSALVAALFALHPLHVEPVAWIAERKEVLCALFWFLAILCHLRYVRRPATGSYLGLLAVFALSLAAKPMAVTLPFVLLLLDGWPLGRLRREGIVRPALEKVPLLALSAASCVVTLRAQRAGTALTSASLLPIPLRVANALRSWGLYLLKTVWPDRLAHFYSHPGLRIDMSEVVAAGLAVVALSALAVAMAKRSPFVPVGWFWYLGTLVPVIGIVQVGAQSHADRYTYLPLVGVFVAAVWGAGSLVAQRPRILPAASLAAVVIIIALSATTAAQVGRWRDGPTLDRHAIAVTRDNFMAHNGLGAYLADRGDFTAALPHLREAVRILPGFWEARENLAQVLAALGRSEEAMAEYRLALRGNPDLLVSTINLGVLLASRGDREGALERFGEAIRIAPTNLVARVERATVLAESGRLDEAVNAYTEALRLSPRDPVILFNRGLAEARGGDRKAALRDAEALRPLDPTRADALLAEIAGRR